MSSMAHLRKGRREEEKIGLFRLDFLLGLWGYSSVGRAPALHAGSQEFESPYLHQTTNVKTERSKSESLATHLEK